MLWISVHNNRVVYVVSVSLNDEIEHKLQERQQEIKFCDQ